MMYLKLPCASMCDVYGLLFKLIYAVSSLSDMYCDYIRFAFHPVLLSKPLGRFWSNFIGASWQRENTHVLEWLQFTMTAFLKKKQKENKNSYKRSPELLKLFERKFAVTIDINFPFYFWSSQCANITNMLTTYR